jgi:hypothetical protein
VKIKRYLLNKLILMIFCFGWLWNLVLFIKGRTHRLYMRTGCCEDCLILRGMKS